MNRRRTGWLLRSMTLAAILSVVLLAACGGGAAGPTPGEPAPAAPTPTSAIPAASPEATPSPAATPTSGPAGTPTGLEQPVTLAQALDNLEAQGSYVLDMSVSGFPGAAGTMSTESAWSRLTLTRSGEDRHVELKNHSGATVMEMWHVHGQDYVDFGSGHHPGRGATPPAGRMLGLMSMPEQLLRRFSADPASYTITGTETIDGVETTVEHATYQLSASNEPPMMMHHGGNAESTLWVANEGHYLMRLELTVTPAHDRPATVRVDVSQVGTAPQVTEPTP